MCSHYTHYAITYNIILLYLHRNLIVGNTQHHVMSMSTFYSSDDLDLSIMVLEQTDNNNISEPYVYTLVFQVHLLLLVVTGTQVQVTIIIL